MNADERSSENRKEKIEWSLPRKLRGALTRKPCFLFSIFSFLVSASLCVHLWLSPAVYAAQRVVDRIVATIEGEPVTASELADLGKFQQLLGGAAADEKELLRRRIELWVVLADAQAARFPAPASADVEREMARLSSQIGGPDAYQARVRQLGLRAESVRRLVEQQLYVARYLDARFRPAVQVDEQQVEAYYHELAKEIASRGEPMPALEAVREKIRELLIQREISERAGRWLDENRSRTRVVVHGANQ